MTKKCKHNWKEDEMFASGVIKLVVGSPKDLEEETMVVCQKCGETKYVKVKDLGSIIGMIKQKEVINNDTIN